MTIKTGTITAEEHLTGHVRCWMEYERYADWAISRVELNLGTMSKPRWFEVRDPELRDALIEDLSADKFFQKLADAAHVEAFDGCHDAPWESYYDHIKEQAHG